MQCGMSRCTGLTLAVVVALVGLCPAARAEPCDRVVRTACVGEPLDSTEDQLFGAVLVVDVALTLHDVTSRGSFSAGYGGLELLLAGPQLGMATYTAVDLAQAGETGPALLTGAYALWMAALSVNGVREIVGSHRKYEEPTVRVAPSPTPDGGAGFTIAGSF